MKKVSLLVAAALVLGVSASAFALPPVMPEFIKTYPGLEEKVKELGDSNKCMVCHGKSKKDKNEYGKAVGKFVTKAKVNELKDDEAARSKYIVEGLTKAADEKSSGGKTFGEIIKEGKLPGGS